MTEMQQDQQQEQQQQVLLDRDARGNKVGGSEQEQERGRVRPLSLI